MLTHIAYGQKMEVVYRSKTDSLQNFYLSLLPAGVPKGLLLILPGFATTPSEILKETNLPQLASDSGYAVIIPLLVNYEVVDTLNLVQSRLQTLIPEVIGKYGIPPNRFILGGHSLGGHQALFYAEQAIKMNLPQVVKPNLVFGVDPPLDMKRLWTTFSYNRRINFSKVSVEESTYFMNQMEKLYGGKPAQKPAAYEQYSSFYRDAAEGGNIKYLRHIPVRLYCDPDINWVIENRRGAYEYMNASDLSAAISQLRLLGNQSAELMICLGKGYLPDGRRHPHAFSMLDANEFIVWINASLPKN
ncbi:hypothetical protein DVR12_20590 [Chitinophaga silvatica]|uniref:Alpha/beta hydrolase n=2 Tax=Chitinophaga silvatica TaxID=2282649 RepID=A0A3E1Y6E4_9BACT|nr:hypothetical protein DVR12_20590 [Chitinophaga silvatica]